MVDQDSEAPLAVVTGANTGLGFETAKGLIRQGFRVIVSAHPGLSRTALFDHGVASRAMVGSLFKLLMPLITQTAAEGARPTLFAATAEEVRPRDYIGPAGFAETRGTPKRAYIAANARDTAIAERLWQISCELTGADWRTA
ncbi:hypothetical protein MHM84_05935 [Halomonas sp. McH1-25]|uniref:hypothetical protein n=1 Tax=unclassified Halomonas TaxID=2609666 RepID=UPI001EF72D1F|nr:MULTISPECIES: hypothetical protein [unclassified Halomonas]MCG7599318.1 hypothetical protein [Halomonas sp. McH1-25]MCP1341186.1 hypothetical protein [Halomonas sp. FL8]MCP1362092.1 hypothetical protein [Halomonas sp. BBD45]